MQDQKFYFKSSCYNVSNGNLFERAFDLVLLAFVHKRAVQYLERHMGE